MRDLGMVSIITPTWNCGRFIAETIESVLAQSYSDWEMLIVDDCSTDDTREVVEAYSDLRIKYHRLDKNSGAAIARNSALRLAKGRWIAFLDSDDLWKPDKLERQIMFMIENGYIFSYHNYIEIDENSRFVGKVISGPNHISKVGMYSYCWPGCLTVMYDRTQIGLVQIEDIKKNNDYAIWLKVCKKATCHLLNETLASYRKRSGSISHHGYKSLIKWHYKLFHDAERLPVLTSLFLTTNNLFWGVLKKIVYVR